MRWIVSGYALTFGLSLVASGRLGDVLGRRAMFLVASTAFVATSALAGAAPTEALLIGARLVKGLAGGRLGSTVLGVLLPILRAPERRRCRSARSTSAGSPGFTW